MTAMEKGVCSKHSLMLSTCHENILYKEQSMFWQYKEAEEKKKSMLWKYKVEEGRRRNA